MLILPGELGKLRMGVRTDATGSQAGQLEQAVHQGAVARSEKDSLVPQDGDLGFKFRNVGTIRRALIAPVLGRASGSCARGVANPSPPRRKNKQQTMRSYHVAFVRVYFSLNLAVTTQNSQKLVGFLASFGRRPPHAVRVSHRPLTLGSAAFLLF